MSNSHDWKAEKYYSTKEVAEFLGFSPWTVRDWIRTKKLEAVKIQGQLRVTETSLKKFLEGRHG